LNVAAAVVRQSNVRACSSPVALSNTRHFSSVAMRVNAACICPTLPGSSGAAALPSVSASAPQVDDNTGHPQAIASTGGRPKPSKSDGKTMLRARYQSGRSFCARKPRQ